MQILFCITVYFLMMLFSMKDKYFDMHLRPTRPSYYLGPKVIGLCKIVSTFVCDDLLAWPQPSLSQVNRLGWLLYDRGPKTKHNHTKPHIQYTDQRDHWLSSCTIKTSSTVTGVFNSIFIWLSCNWAYPKWLCTYLQISVCCEESA